MRLTLCLLAAGLFGAAAAGSVAAQTSPAAPTISFPSHAGVSVRLSDLPPAPPAEQAHEVPILRLPPAGPEAPGNPNSGGGSQGASGTLGAAIGTAFPGLGYNGSYPADPNIAVGRTYIVQAVNTEIQVYDKFGHPQMAQPKSLAGFWSTLGGPCAANSDGDPIVQYDNQASRWIITQIGTFSTPYTECIAVSQSDNPMGFFNQYSYTFAYFNDYPKFGVWPTTTNSAYLATYNLFQGNTLIGGDLCAYDRNAMLAGSSFPVSICYTVATAGYLPADLDGATPPADGTPGYFLDFNTASTLRLYTLSPNFQTPATSTLTLVTPDISVPVFSEACNGGSCIQQPSTGRKLDSLGDRLMYRLAYRMLGTASTPTMVVNHSVAAGSSVGVRWYQLQPLNGGFSVVQSGTWAPDSNYRWMGSAAMDKVGDVALGYSKSGKSVYPSLAVTGRVPGDPAGTMEAEAVIQPGGGSQTLASRWGDYSALRIDPTDDCTFWYTGEYMSRTSFYVWSTAVGSLKFPSCQ
jgi:hypothetical protein